MRIAAIDIGTNSIHMIVVQVRQDLSFDVVDREKDMVRLGAGGLDGRSLTPTAMTSALHTLAKFKRLAESHKVDEIIAAATSATREADNGGDFIAQVDRETGIRIKVISGTEEARLIHMAAAYGVDVGSSAAVVVDIGGGSVEVTLGTAKSLTLGKSFKAGVIRLTERFVKTDPLARHDERRLVKFVNREMGVYLDQLAGRGFDRLIGTSGTILSLGTMAVADASGTAPEDVRNRARICESAPPAPQAPRRSGHRRTPARAGHGSAPRRSRQSPASCSSTRSSAGLARTSSRSATSRCAKGWCSTTSTATARGSARWSATRTSAAAA